MWVVARDRKFLVPFFVFIGLFFTLLFLLPRSISSDIDVAAPAPHQAPTTSPPPLTRAVLDTTKLPSRTVVLSAPSSSLASAWQHLAEDDVNPWWNDTTKRVKSHSSNGLSICDFGFGILTSPKFIHTRLQDVTRSWVRRLCQEEDNFFFVSNETLPAIEHPTMVTNCSDAYEQLCCKSVQNVFLLNTALPRKKWYMKVDDDTLVIPKNLVDELSIYDHTKPLLIGCPYFLILDKRTLRQKIWGRPLLPWGSQPGDEHGPVEANLMYVSGGMCSAIP
jgi:hypothetical protein